MPTPATQTRYLLAMRLVDPARWRGLVRDALAATAGVPEAARALGVSRPTLYRWLGEDPTLADGIALPGPGPREKTTE